MMSGLAKAVLPIREKPSAQFILPAAFKRSLVPVFKELLPGDTEMMNSKVTGIIMEADENGIFDI